MKKIVFLIRSEVTGSSVKIGSSIGIRFLPTSAAGSLDDGDDTGPVGVGYFWNKEDDVFNTKWGDIPIFETINSTLIKNNLTKYSNQLNKWTN